MNESPMIPADRDDTENHEWGLPEAEGTVADLHALIAGQVVAVNPAVSIASESLNANPWTTWICRLEPDRREDVAGLLTAQAYAPLSDCTVAGCLHPGGSAYSTVC